MIKVSIYRNKGRVYGFEMSGHADSVSEGYDLVCAGVSAVSFGSVNAVIQLCDIEPVIEQAEQTGGYLRMELPKQLSEEVRQKAELLLEGMLVALQTIERDYGRYIKISE